jgi:predicted MFS family arabinose efflux permease
MTQKNTVRSILTRDYVISFLAFFGFLIAFNALAPTLPIYLKGVGSSAREIGALVGTMGISSLISRLLVGKVLIKRSEKLIMMWGALLFAVSFLALVVFRPFWPLFLARLLQGIAFACLDTAALAYAIRIMPVANRARAISYFLMAPSLAAAIAASSAVFVVNHYSFTVLLMACTGCSLGAFVLSGILKQGDAARPMAATSVNTVYFERKILAPAVTSFLFYFCTGAIGAFFPLYSVECGVMNPGLFFSAAAVMIIVVRTVGGKVFDICSKEGLIVVFLLLSMVNMVMLFFSSTLPMFVVVGLLWGTGVAFLVPVTLAYALEYAGSSDGTAVGSHQAFMDLGLALGPVIMGIIAPLVGYRLLFLCLALICLINLCYFQVYLRRKGKKTSA